MGGSSFDLIAQEIQKQHHIMEEMKAENRRLRQQLTDLRGGQGIFLEINGTLMALDAQMAPTLSATSPQPIKSSPIATAIPPQDTRKSSEQQMPTTGQENSQIGTSSREQKSVPDTVTASQQNGEITRRPSTFLEEIMLDEFKSALTAPTTIQQAQKPEISPEEKQAALRRELIGSFLLE